MIISPMAISKLGRAQQQQGDVTGRGAIRGSHQGIAGASGVDLGEAKVFLSGEQSNFDKIHFKLNGADTHLTLHLGPQSGVIDIHVTRESISGPGRHETVFSISHIRAVALLRRFARLNSDLLTRAVRPLSRQWLLHGGHGVIIGALPSQSELSRLIYVRKRRLRIDEEKLRSQVRIAQTLDEIDASEGRILTLFVRRRGAKPRVIGHGFVVTAKGRRHLMWIPTWRLAAVIEQTWDELLPLLKRHGKFHRSANADEFC